MAYKKRRYTAKRKTYSKRKTSSRKRKAAPRAQTLVIKIVGAGSNGVMTSTATLGKKSGRPVYARF